MGTFRKSYHPERHYMRGPGPKWHEKHDRIVQALQAAYECGEAKKMTRH